MPRHLLQLTAGFHTGYGGGGGAHVAKYLFGQVQFECKMDVQVHIPNFDLQFFLLLNIILVLPVGTATAERSFIQMKLIKVVSGLELVTSILED